MESVHEGTFLESEAYADDLVKAADLEPIISNTRQAIIAQAHPFYPPRADNDDRQD